MPRVADDILLTHLEVALAIASPATLQALATADNGGQRRARLDLARHLADRLTGVVSVGEGGGALVPQPCLFSDDFWPLG